MTGRQAGSVRTVVTGLRIPWGLAFLPDGTALVTERGNPVPAFDGPHDAGGVPRIMSVTPDGRPAAGRNDGWPRGEGFSTNAEYTNPIATWTPTSVASPSGIAVLGQHIYVACLRGQSLYRLDLDGRNPQKLLDTHGRLRTAVVAPDGSLWVTTSNRDQVGREDRLPQTPEGDRILRFTPP